MTERSPPDLRAFLAEVERSLPGQLMRIERHVSPKFGVTAVLQRLEDMGRFPLAVFENVDSLTGDAGRKVVSLVDERQEPGAHEITWDAKDERGQMVSTGVYMTRLEVAGEVTTRRMNMVK